jgi:hypothetical protein
MKDRTHICIRSYIWHPALTHFNDYSVMIFLTLTFRQHYLNFPHEAVVGPIEFHARAFKFECRCTVSVCTGPPPPPPPQKRKEGGVYYFFFVVWFCVCVGTPPPPPVTSELNGSFS